MEYRDIELPTEQERTARQEAYRRYQGDRVYSDETGEMESHDDYGYADTARDAFVAGAEWAATGRGMVEALVWMMGQPRLTSGGNTAIVLSNFIRSCAAAHDIDLAKEVLDAANRRSAEARDRQRLC